MPGPRDAITFSASILRHDERHVSSGEQADDAAEAHLRAMPASEAAQNAAYAPLTHFSCQFIYMPV